MSKNVLTTFAFNLQYAQMLLADVPQEKMCEQPGGIVNHPAWIVGHLGTTYNFIGQLLGFDPVCPPEWDKLFGMDSKPTNNPSEYPNKDELLKKLQEGHALAAKAFGEVADDALEKANPIESLAPMFPTVGELIAFLLTSHEAIHLGQLSAWRRAQGLPSVF